MTKFTMKRSGEFQIRTSGDNHCGVKDPLKMKYTFLVECGEDSLDGRGFLFDQMSVQKYFEREAHGSMIQPVQESCEVFARRASRELFKLVKNENKGCDISRLCLTLSPEPFLAELTFEWEPNGDEKTSEPKPPYAILTGNDKEFKQTPKAASKPINNTRTAMYKGREYNVVSYDKKKNVYRLSFTDGSVAFWAKGSLVTPLSKQDPLPLASSDEGYSDEHAKEFGYTPEAWFDLVNGMDSGEYKRFVERLRADVRKSKTQAPDLGDVTAAF